MSEELIECFLKSDRNHDEVVRKRLPLEYARKMFPDNQDIQGKLEALDDDGDITMEEYCKMFRIDLNNCRQQRFKFADDLSHISNSIQIVTYDDQTPVETMVFITDNAIDALDNKPNPKEAAKFLKQQLDKNYNRLWHVVVVKGQYWSYYSHEPGCMAVFKYGCYIFLVWRTPGY